LGAVLINALKSWATRAIPDMWLILLGSLFLVVVLFLPQGLISIPARIRELRSRGRNAPTPVNPVGATSKAPVS
jgi:urea transport system permease protein